MKCGETMNKKQNWVIIILFLVLIFGMTGVSLLKPDREFSEKENRSLAQSPMLSVEDYFSGAFAKDYEAYITDQFILRDEWIGMKTKVERAVGKQEINDIYFAKDDYLIEKHTGSFTTDTAKRNISSLAQFMQFCEEKYGEGHVTAMVVPNAVKVLEDKLPPFASPFDEAAYMGEIRDALPRGTWFDSLSVLEKHSQEELYYRTDHHWKTLAAFYVYEAWAKSVGLTPPAVTEYQVETVTEDFQGTIEAKVGGETVRDSIQTFRLKEEAPYTLRYNRQEDTTDDLYHREALDTREKYNVYFGGNQPIVEADIQNESERRLLVIKDSYAHCFLPFTFHDFGEVDFVDLRYFNESLKELLESKEYTDILFLYNASGFAEDPSVAKLNH